MRSRRDRRWWQTTVAAWQGSGRSAEEFSAEHDLHPATLRWWRRRLEILAAEESESALTVLRVEVAPSTPAPEPAALTALVGPAELRIAIGTDAAYVGAVVAAIARAVDRC